MLERLKLHRLYAKLKKCEFSSKRVEFLRYVVTPDSVAIEESRIDTIRD